IPPAFSQSKKNFTLEKKMALSMKTASGVTARAAKPAAAKSMMVWQPNNNKFFETFSYLPPLTNDQIAKQVDYIVNNGWTPCLEFSNDGYVSNDSVVRLSGVSANYYDNRYWTLWKLPMFGCTDATQVLREIEAATKAFPDAYIRMAAFDAVRQVQVASMLVHRPASNNDYRKPNERQV
ncbi:ribulose bisphosphate carboxylase small subunit, partial [Blautia sp. MSJ-36]